MITYHFYGALSHRIGKKWTLAVNTVSEGFRAIDANLHGALKEYWTHNGREKKYRVKLGDYAINDEVELHSPVGQIKDVHVVPVVKGSNSGIGKIIAGVVMVVVAWYLPTSWALLASALYGMGTSLILGGVMQMLTPIPNMNQNAGREADASKSFAGNIASVTQGDSVPIVYGRMLVSPSPISISISNTSAAVTNSYYFGGSPGQYQLPGGGISIGPSPGNMWNPPSFNWTPPPWVDLEGFND